MFKWERFVPTSFDEVSGSFSIVEKLGIGQDTEVTQHLVHFEVIVRQYPWLRTLLAISRLAFYPACQNRLCTSPSSSFCSRGV